MKPRLKILLPAIVLLASCQTMETLQGKLAELTTPDTSAAQSTDQSVETAEVYYRLGLRYANGIGGEQDLAAAADNFRKAAGQGHAESQLMLGVAYLSGKGVKQDYVEAHHWLQLSAQQGVAESQLRLGGLYLNGRGVPVEEAWGMQWIGRAADQGNAEAQYQFGVGYATGLGIEKDLQQGWLWVALAAAQQDADAKKLLPQIASRLNAEQLQQAKAMLADWSAQTPESTPARGLVRFVQYSLEVQGFEVGVVDGWMGPMTAAAIANFQREVLAEEATGRLSDALVLSLRARMRGEVTSF